MTIVVTSAGIEAFDPVAEITPEKWDRLMAVNLTGTFVCMQLAVPDMVEAGWGRIVTISSSSAQSGAPNMAHYVASKGGVIGLTKAFARELAGTQHHRQHHSTDHRGHPDGPKGSGGGHVPSVEIMAAMVPLGRAGTPGRHCGRLFLPLLRGRRLRHRADHRGQRRDVHLSAPAALRHAGRRQERRRDGCETSKPVAPCSTPPRG